MVSYSPSAYITGEIHSMHWAFFRQNNKLSSKGAQCLKFLSHFIYNTDIQCGLSKEFCSLSSNTLKQNVAHAQIVNVEKIIMLVDFCFWNQ
jgi:hypothetical protein